MGCISLYADYCHKAVDSRRLWFSKHHREKLVSWSLTSLFSTNMAISETTPREDTIISHEVLGHFNVFVTVVDHRFVWSEIRPVVVL